MLGEQSAKHDHKEIPTSIPRNGNLSWPSNGTNKETHTLLERTQRRILLQVISVMLTECYWLYTYLQHFQWELKKVGWKYFWRIMKRKPPEIRHILDNIIKKQKTTKPHNKTEVHILLWNRTEFWVSHQRNSSQPRHLQIQISPKAEGV